MLKGKKRNLFFFVVIYLVFGVLLTYLLYFNTGLEFVQEATEAGVKVYLKNSSVHLIQNIEVVDEEGEEIASFEQLLPEEKKLLEFGEKMDSRLQAKAPFHVSVEMKLGAAKVTKKGASLSYSTSYPSIVFEEEEFNVKVEVCAKENEIKGIEIFPELNAKVEFLDGDKVVLNVAKDSCKEAAFNFKALQEGVTTIRFKIKALNSIKEVESKITIMGVE